MPTGLWPIVPDIISPPNEGLGAALAQWARRTQSTAEVAVHAGPIRIVAVSVGTYRLIQCFVADGVFVSSFGLCASGSAGYGFGGWPINGRASSKANRQISTSHQEALDPVWISSATSVSAWVRT
jgi:hypothetical protein